MEFNCSWISSLFNSLIRIAMGYKGSFTIAILAIIKTPLPFLTPFVPPSTTPPLLTPHLSFSFLVRSLFQLKFCVKNNINKMELYCLFFLSFFFSHCKNRFAFFLLCSLIYFLVCQKQPHSLQSNEIAFVVFIANP